MYVLLQLYKITINIIYVMRVSKILLLNEESRVLKSLQNLSKFAKRREIEKCKNILTT